MADILVSIDSIAGESTVADYLDQIECVAMSHAISQQLTSLGTDRTQGSPQHGTVNLVHLRDLASPGLRLAVSAGQNLGEVKITRLNMIGGELRAVEAFMLFETYVVRVDMETPLNNETARPADEPYESFSLEYSSVSMEIKQYRQGDEVGAVAVSLGDDMADAYEAV